MVGRGGLASDERPGTNTTGGGALTTEGATRERCFEAADSVKTATWAISAGGRPAGADVLRELGTIRNGTYSPGRTTPEGAG